MPSYSQKGTTSLLIPIIIGLFVIGGAYFINKNVSSPPKTDTPQKNLPAASSVPTSTIQRKTYKNEKFGYSIKYPTDWVLENLPSKDSEVIRITDANKSAFVLIDTIIGPSLEKTGAMEKVINLLEDRLRKNAHLKINEFTRSTAPEKDISGYIATGEETYNEKTVLFEERFVVSKNGRGIRMHSAYSPDSKGINKPTTTAIMNSFTTK